MTRIILGRSGSSASSSPSTTISTPARDAGSLRGVSEVVEDAFHDGARGSGRERDDGVAGLELAEEEDVVDQLPDLSDLCLRLPDEVLEVRAGEGRALEQREEPRERRSQLVRDGRGEPCT